MWYAILILLLCVMTSLWASLYLKYRLYDGQIVLSRQDSKTIFMLELNVEPEDLMLKKAILFKVVVGAPSEDSDNPQE